MAAGGTTRLAHIDGLRAVAILMVVAFHVGKTGVLGAAATPLGRVLQQGYHGVELFFILSGFCLAYPTLESIQSKGAAIFDVDQFAARRITRIVPPYWIAIACISIALTISGKAPALYEIVRNLLFIDGEDSKINGSFWSLGVEFRWYFLFPFLLLLFVRSRRAFALVGALVLGATLTQAKSEDLFMLPGFMLGIVAAWMSFLKLPRVAFLAACCTLVGSAVATVFLATTNGWDSQHVQTAFVAAFSLVLIANASALIRRILSLRLLSLVGVASYSIYLVHQPVLDWLVSIGVHPIFAAVLAICAGFAFWYAAERPFVSGSERKRLMAGLSPHIPRYLRAVSVPEVLFLNRFHVVRRLAAPERSEMDAVAAVD